MSFFQKKTPQKQYIKLVHVGIKIKYNVKGINSNDQAANPEMALD